MSLPIITKVKSLKREGKRLIWNGHNRTKRSATLEVSLQYNANARYFHVMHRHRERRSANWTLWRDAEQPDSDHLISLLKPEDIAACAAAAIARRTPQS